MAQKDGVSPKTVPKETQAAATDKGALPLSKLVLLGTFTGPSGDQAILRSRRGKIISAKTGDIIEGDRVVGIEDGSVLLNRKGRARRLTMPGT